jgi:hypothetical protein
MHLWHAGDPNVCWICDTSLNGQSGYAKLTPPQGKTNGAHRYIAGWFLAGRGEGLKRRLTLDHQCHRNQNKRCCNPWHLEEITGQENKERSAALIAGRSFTYGPSIAGRTGGEHCACDYEPVVAAIEAQLEQQSKAKAARGEELKAERARKPLRLPRPRLIAPKAAGR